MAETELLSMPFDEKKGDFQAFAYYEALMTDDEEQWQRWEQNAEAIARKEQERVNKIRRERQKSGNEAKKRL